MFPNFVTHSIEMGGLKGEKALVLIKKNSLKEEEEEEEEEEEDNQNKILLRSSIKTKLILEKMEGNEPIKRIEELLSFKDYFWEKANFRPPREWNVSYTHCYLLEQRNKLKRLRSELNNLNSKSRGYPKRVGEKVRKIEHEKELLKKLLKDSNNGSSELLGDLMHLEDKIEILQSVFFSSKSKNNTYIKNNGVIRLNHAIEGVESRLFQIGKVAFEYVRN